MIQLLYSMPRYSGYFNDEFPYTVEGCNAAKYFLDQIRKCSTIEINICVERLSGYEIVSIANQKLNEMVGL